MEPINTILKLVRHDRDGNEYIREIDLYNIVSCYPYQTYQKWNAQWVCKHVDIEVVENGETSRHILDAKEYFQMLNIALNEMDSFGWLFGKISDDYRYND